jgi:3-oxoacyl-[acyl-carrier protein] reductase
MDLNLSAKRAIVCGSTKGIGKAIALELAQMGASVTLVARNEQALDATMRELPSSDDQRHEYLVADFSRPDELRAVIDSYVPDHDVHILVNNTGGPPGGQAIDAEVEEFIKAFSAHLVCNQILTQAVVPGMKKAGFGRIINIISTSVKMPIRGLGVSNTIRGAVANWAKTLSLELGPFGITVNNVLPGATMTDRLLELNRLKAEKTGKPFDTVMEEMKKEIPAGRLAQAHEVAAAAAFLASPAAGYINGINVPVDGGRTGSL